MSIRKTLQRGLQMAEVAVGRALRRPPHSLPFLVCFLTFRCNSRCRMCDFWRTPVRQAEVELSTAEWSRVIDEAADLGAWVVSMSGGEPLLRPDCAALIRRAHDRGLTTHLCTNGLLLDSERARALGDAGLDSVNVSLDSPVAAVHNHLRGRDLFDDAVAGIRRLTQVAPNVRVGVNCVITRVNYKDLAPMVAFAESLGAKALRFGPLHTNLLHREKDPESYGNLVLTPADVPVLEAEVRRLLAAFDAGRVHRNSRPFLRGAGRVARGLPHHGCVAGFATACVDPYGFVAPCPDIEGRESVRTAPLGTIWRSADFQRLRRRVLHCRRPCWDTTYAELSLRFRLRSTLADPRQFLGELNFYLD
jgi:pyrroloquinoline quinone biosynthesis protein E